MDLRKRLSHSLQFDASYTVGWAFNTNDSVGDNGSNVTDSNNPSRDYGFSSSDQRNRFVIQGVYQPAFNVDGPLKYVVNGFNFGTNATVTSGFPYTAIAGTDLNGDGVNNDYPLFGSRNVFRGPIFREWNVRGSRIFALYRDRVSLEVIAEAENILKLHQHRLQRGRMWRRDQYDLRQQSSGRTCSTYKYQLRHTNCRFRFTSGSVGRPPTLLTRVLFSFAFGLAVTTSGQAPISPSHAITPTHKLLVVSVDGLDWRYLRDRDQMGERIPNLRHLLAVGQVAGGVIGVWPTITWPSHTSLITGVRPDQHGILGNRMPRAEGGDYYWSAHLIQVPTLLTCAAAHGLTSATITWPVTVDAPVTYDLPEYFRRRNGGSMDTETIASKAKPSTLVDDIARDFPSFAQQWTDDRTRTLAVVWLLEHKQPDLILVHLVDLDSDQHDMGPYNASSRAIVERTDDLIGQMLRAMPAGYDIVVTSDHGFERVDHQANLGVLLKQHGIAGQVRSLGGIATTDDPTVAAFLTEESKAGRDGIGRIIPRSELEKYAPELAHVALAIEPAEHFMFGFGAPPASSGALTAAGTAAELYLAPPVEKGNHGFWPLRHDYRSVYLLAGPGQTPERLPEIEMISTKDRLAAALGIRCP